MLPKVTACTEHTLVSHHNVRDQPKAPSVHPLGRLARNLNATGHTSPHQDTGTVGPSQLELTDRETTLCAESEEALLRGQRIAMRVQHPDTARARELLETFDGTAPTVASANTLR